MVQNFTHGELLKEGPLKSIIILVAWELWCECNARIFRQVASTPATIIAKIKEEARAWIVAGATKLTEIIPVGE